ncbi:MAG: GntR family transcriptional regulator [Actinomycetia bacterium]|nr:GntR family transcriptional regulator [Actinomycetes bacterium]
MASVDRASPLPLWAQVESDLRRRMDRGEFDERFPTDEELVDSYEVSRHTAREAVRRLSQEGLVVRERGRGTVLAGGHVEQPLDSMYSLFEAVEAGGLEQTSEVLGQRTVTDAEAAGALGLEPDASLVLIERLRRADGEPLAVDRVWLPEQVGTPLAGTDWSHTSLYEQLAQHGTGRPDSGWERVRAVMPSQQDAERLGLDGPDAVFCLERLGQVADRPVEWRRSLVRADRFAVVTRFEAGRTEASLRLTNYGDSRK